VAAAPYDVSQSQISQQICSIVLWRKEILWPNNNNEIRQNYFLHIELDQRKLKKTTEA